MGEICRWEWFIYYFLTVILRATTKIKGHQLFWEKSAPQTKSWRATQQWRRLSSGDWRMRGNVVERERRACTDDNVTTSPASSHTTTATLSTTTATVWRRGGLFDVPTCRRQRVEMGRLHSAPERRRRACCREPGETGLAAVSRTEVRDDRCCGTDFRLTQTCTSRQNYRTVIQSHTIVMSTKKHQNCAYGPKATLTGYWTDGKSNLLRRLHLYCIMFYREVAQAWSWGFSPFKLNVITPFKTEVSPFSIM